MMRPEKIQRVAAVAVLLATTLVALRLLGVLSALSDAGFFLLDGIAVPVRRVTASVWPTDDVAKSCSEEFGEIETLKLENSRLRTLVSENAALKTALDFRDRESGRLVMARVLSQSVDPTFSGLIIDGGNDIGLSPGQPVLVGDGIIIGKIQDVWRQSASVLLFSDSLSRLAVTVQGGSGTSGVLGVDRGMSLTISLIPQAERIAPGDMVVTSGLEPGIRAGLIVGIVERVQGNGQEPFQTAVVRPFESAARPVLVQVMVSDGTIESITDDQKSESPSASTAQQ